MTTCLYVYFAGIVLIVLAIREWNKSDRERRRAAAELRRKNEAIVAFRIECGAKLVRVDRLTQEEISACVPYKGPQPLKVGELFISCGNACQKAAACPVLRKFLDPSCRHNLTLGDGFKLVQSRTFDRNGAGHFRLENIIDGEYIPVRGAVFEGKDNLRCYVRTCRPHYSPPYCGEEPADKNEPAGNLKD